MKDGGDQNPPRLGLHNAPITCKGDQDLVGKSFFTTLEAQHEQSADCTFWLCATFDVEHCELHLYGLWSGAKVAGKYPLFMEHVYSGRSFTGMEAVGIRLYELQRFALYEEFSSAIFDVDERTRFDADILQEKFEERYGSLDHLIEQYHTRSVDALAASQGMSKAAIILEGL